MYISPPGVSPCQRKNSTAFKTRARDLASIPSDVLIWFGRLSLSLTATACPSALILITSVSPSVPLLPFAVTTSLPSRRYRRRRPPHRRSPLPSMPHVAASASSSSKGAWRPTKIMNMKDLSRDDDFLSHLLVEKLGTGTVPLVVHKMDPTRRLPKSDADQLLQIIRRVGVHFNQPCQKFLTLFY